MAADSQNGEVAVWWFVGATVASISPTLFFSHSPLWLQVGIIVVGLALLTVGFRKYPNLKRG